MRSFFRYKTEVIRYRFQTKPSFFEKDADTKFYHQKQEIQLLTRDFIALLKKIKNNKQTLEFGIRTLFFDNNKTPLKKLIEITEKLSTLLHYFSEENLHLHPKFLKFNVILAQNLSLVKKCMNEQLYEFFEELETNYKNLEKELEDLIEAKSIKKSQLKKQREEKLTL